jgi:hypothetical protein
MKLTMQLTTTLLVLIKLATKRVWRVTMKLTI